MPNPKAEDKRYYSLAGDKIPYVLPKNKSLLDDDIALGGSPKAYGVKLSISDEAAEIATTLGSAGFQCYVVGGFVRDALLRMRQKKDAKVAKPIIQTWQEKIMSEVKDAIDDASDIDFTTDATPKQVQALFKKVIPTGIQHGTVTVYHKRTNFEITTFRADQGYSDGRRPDQVSYAKTLREDVNRRDFTINALAYDIRQNIIVDFFGGIEDLKNQRLVAIGDADTRIKEDALRILRGCRFASTLSLKMDDGLIRAIKNNKKCLNKISAERIRDELKKALALKGTSGLYEQVNGGSLDGGIGDAKAEAEGCMIEIMHDCGLTEHILPEFHACFGVQQNRHHSYDVAKHSIMAIDHLQSVNFFTFQVINHFFIRNFKRWLSMRKDPYKRFGGDFYVGSRQVIDFFLGIFGEQTNNGRESKTKIIGNYLSKYELLREMDNQTPKA